VYKLLTVALLLVLPCFLSAQDHPEWGKHAYIWDYTKINLDSDLGLSTAIDLKAILSGEDKETVLPTINGELINHDFLIGKIVLIDFWYINCPPCRRELPALSEISKLYPDKEVIILSISRDDASAIREYDLNEYRFSFPFKVLIGPEGRIVHSYIGGKKTLTPVKDFVEEMSSKIDVLIAETDVP